MANVIINPQYGGSETGKINNSFIEKNFNLDIAKVIYNSLKEKGIETSLLRDSDQTISLQDRLNLIDKLVKPNEENILISTTVAEGGSSGAEIIYALRNEDDLASQISNELEISGLNVLKYYQLRNPDDTSKDFYAIIREPENTESMIISLGYIDNSVDNNYLLNNVEKLGKSIANGIYNYIKKENIYVVKSGDTLFNIANKFNVTVQAIKNINNLSSNILNVGQELVIPKEETPSTSGEFINYTVKAGDSLYKIANTYNTTVNAIMNVNNLTSNALQVGQVLKIPTTTSQEETTNYINYTVKSGDSLYKIANTYNTTVDAIKKLNNLTSNNLQINQVLKIPTTSQQETTSYINYTVKSGDSLYKIANNYNTTVDEIKKLNNLTSNNLQINQVLKIPTTSQQETTSYINYTVKSGDSLYKIANTYNTTVDSIKKLNNLTSNNLQINQVLKIPK
ncbi:MAG: LysM peptidoglycan-binding domain-containing protein [Bacilli bacterium]